MNNTTRKGFFKSLAALLPVAALAAPVKGSAQTTPTYSFTFAPGWQGTAKVTVVSIASGRARLQVSAVGNVGAAPTVGRSQITPRNFYHPFVGVGGMDPHAAFLDGNGDLRFWAGPAYNQFYCDFEYDF